jgi:hypothetical protein
MTSPVFPVPLIPPQPARAPAGLACPSWGRSAAAARPSAGEHDDAGTPLIVTVEDRGEVCVVHADGEVDIATAPLLGRR